MQTNKIKILNLYACLGGNRLKWDTVANIEVTAVELDPVLAELYQERFPADKVIIADAHQYLLDHYKEYDFIWTSPPCPTHSKMRLTNTGSGSRKSKATYPDLRLYEEILLLTHFFKGKFCVENVIPYYEPLIQAQKRDRHLYWANFVFPKIISYRKCDNFIHAGIDKLSAFHDYDFRKYTGEQRVDKIARNLVDYEAGLTIFKTAFNIIEESKITQATLF